MGLPETRRQNLPQHGLKWRALVYIFSGLFNNAFSVETTERRAVGCYMNGELGSVSKEVVVA
jgi:hypothetical protein